MNRLLILCMVFAAFAARADWSRVAEEWGPVPPSWGPWFGTVRSPKGVPCCNVADGHPTDEDWKTDGETWVPHPLPDRVGQWIKVPADVIIHNAGNPTGRAIAWWVQRADQPDGIFWRCFVHGGGV